MSLYNRDGYTCLKELAMTTYYWEYEGTRLRPLNTDDVDAYLSADQDSAAKRVLNLSIPGNVMGIRKSVTRQTERDGS